MNPYFNEFCFYSGILEPLEDLSQVKFTTEESQLELRLAMEKTRRLKAKGATKQWDANEIAKSIKREPIDEREEEAMDVNGDSSRIVVGSSIVLNATAEFCRTLGDIPTYGMAGNRDEDEDELLVLLKFC